MTQNVSLKSQVYRLLKCNFNDPYNIAFFDFQDGSCPPFWNKIKILNSHAFQRQVLCHHVEFCGDLSYCRDITIFRIFSSEM